jgi:hypothetical protein
LPACAGNTAAYARSDHSHGSPVLPAMPAPPEPGNSVQAATGFGLPAQAGSSADYARADHSHGSPALPALPELPEPGGDLAGPLARAQVTGLRGVPLRTGAAVAGQVLGFDGTGWAATTLPAPPAVPALPSLGGDLAGSLGQAQVSALQGAPLQLAGAAAGQVLRFDGSGWVPATLPAAPPPPPPAPTNFVLRADKPFGVIGAGEFELKLTNGVALLGTLSSYGGLRAVTATRGAANHEFVVVMQAQDMPNATQDAYALLCTPVRPTGSTLAFTVSVQGGVINDGAGHIRFTVVLSAASQISDGQFALRFAAQVSRFGV